MLSANTDMTKEEYDAYIDKTASDPMFIKACGNFTKESLLEMAFDDKIINGVMSDYMNLRAKADMERQTELYNANNAYDKMTAKLEDIIDKSTDPNKDNYEAQPTSAKIQAAQTALRGLDTLQIIANEQGELEAEDIQTVREAYAALAVQTKSALTGQKDPITNEEYIKSIKALANDENFIKATGNIDKQGVIKFLGDEKAPAKLMDKFIFAKKNGIASETPEKKVNNPNLEPENEGIRRSNTIKPSGGLKL